MAWYKTGTISVANGGVAVTGSGTSWVAGAGIGEAISLPDGKIYEIANISSDSSLTLGSPYLGTTVSGQAYTIVPTQSYIRQLAADASSLVSSYAGVLTGAGSGKFQDGTSGLPGISFSTDVDTGIRRVAANTVAITAGATDQIVASTGGVTVSNLTSNGGIESRATLKTKFNDAYLEFRQDDDTRTGYIQGQGALNRLVINNERAGGEVRIAAGGGNANLIVTPTGVVVNGTLQQGDNAIFEAGRYIDFHSGGNRDYNVRFDAGPDTGVEGGSDAVLTCGTFRSIGTFAAPLVQAGDAASMGYALIAVNSPVKYKIATLPATADGTYDQIRILGTWGGWGATLKYSFDVIASNRGGLTVNLKDGFHIGCALEFWTEADGRVSIWAYLKGIYTAMSFIITDAIAATVEKTLINATPTGTLTATTETMLPRMGVDNAGNVGIGVNPSPSSNARGFELAVNPTYSGPALIHVSGSCNAFYTSNAYFSGTWKYKVSSNTAEMYHQQDGTHWWLSAAAGTAGDAIPFTQAMTLTSSGNLLLGQTFGGYSDTNSMALEASVGYSVFNHYSSTASGVGYLYFGHGGVGVGAITQSGTTSVAYNTTSDHRLKTNVRPANANSFMDIQFRDFEWTDGRHDCGVIAHELQAIYPDLVTGEKDATEVRIVEIEPAVPEVPAVTEQVLVTAAVMGDDGEEIEAAVYETVEVTPAIPAVPAVTEEQTFPVYQQVNYQGLIGRMGTRVQQLQRTVDAQAAIIEAMELRLAALEAA
jgi:hypothetical protein